MTKAMLKAVIIFNPASGGGKAKKRLRKYLNEIKRILPDIRIEETRYQAHAIKLARDLSTEVELIIAAGGDGTLNECANGILKANRQITLASLPIGTGNDIPLPNGMTTSPSELIQALKNPRYHFIDVGYAIKHDRYFLGVASMGFDAEVTYRANKESKRFPGTWNYFMAIFKTLREFKPKNIQIRLSGNVSLLNPDGSIKKELTSNFTLPEKEMMLIAIGNGTRYGGGMLVCPHAKPDDGLLDLTFVRPAKKRVIIKVLPKVYRGTHVKHPLVRTARTKEIEIKSDDLVRLQVDGEVLGFIPETFECIPQALRVLSRTSHSSFKATH